MQLAVVKLPAAKKGFVLLSKQWVVERSCAWAGGFRRLAQDYEQLVETLAGLHFVAFAILMLKRFGELLVYNAQHALALINVGYPGFCSDHTRTPRGPPLSTACALRTKSVPIARHMETPRT
jgi:hypothetical protein